MTPGRVRGFLLRTSCILFVTAFATAELRAVEMERPKIETVDALGVNMTTGQVTHSFTPLRIGGAMGLALQLSVFANEADWGGYRGFRSSLTGRAEAVLLTNE